MMLKKKQATNQKRFIKNNHKPLKVCGFFCRVLNTDDKIIHLQ